MLSLFSRKRLFTLLAMISLHTVSASAMAWDCCDPCPCNCNRMYVGAFGGGIFSNSTRVIQMGTAFFSEIDSIGPLPINASGHTKSTSSGFGGVQIGYEWSKCCCSDWTIAPALELEGFWFNLTKKGHLINAIGSLEEHDFVNSFRIDSGVYLVNAVLSLKSPCMRCFTPYIGGGIGATRINIRDAKSIQVSPVEPGINHFNSRRNDASWAFAAQAKAGLRYTFCEKFHLFGEYRYLFVDFSNYILGATEYPNHVPTSTWNIKVENIQYNAFAIGIQIDI